MLLLVCQYLVFIHQFAPIRCHGFKSEEHDSAKSERACTHFFCQEREIYSLYFDGERFKAVRPQLKLNEESKQNMLLTQIYRFDWNKEKSIFENFECKYELIENDQGYNVSIIAGFYLTKANALFEFFQTFPLFPKLPHPLSFEYSNTYFTGDYQDDYSRPYSGKLCSKGLFGEVCQSEDKSRTISELSNIQNMKFFKLVNKRQLIITGYDDDNPRVELILFNRGNKVGRKLVEIHKDDTKIVHNGYYDRPSLVTLSAFRNKQTTFVFKQNLTDGNIIIYYVDGLVPEIEANNISGYKIFDFQKICEMNRKTMPTVKWESGAISNLMYNTGLGVAVVGIIIFLLSLCMSGARRRRRFAKSKSPELGMIDSEEEEEEDINTEDAQQQSTGQGYTAAGTGAAAAIGSSLQENKLKKFQQKHSTMGNEKHQRPPPGKRGNKFQKENKHKKNNFSKNKKSSNNSVKSNIKSKHSAKSKISNKKSKVTNKTRSVANRRTSKFKKGNAKKLGGRSRLKK